MLTQAARIRRHRLQHRRPRHHLRRKLQHRLHHRRLLHRHPRRLKPRHHPRHRLKLCLSLTRHSLWQTRMHRQHNTRRNLTRSSILNKCHTRSHLWGIPSNPRWLGKDVS